MKAKKPEAKPTLLFRPAPHYPKGLKGRAVNGIRISITHRKFTLNAFFVETLDDKVKWRTYQFETWLTDEDDPTFSLDDCLICARALLNGNKATKHFSALI